jgi:hypothetical protein
VSVKLSQLKKNMVYSKFNNRCGYCGCNLEFGCREYSDGDWSYADVHDITDLSRFDPIYTVNRVNLPYEATIDHIDPVKPPNNNIENLMPSCRSCNTSKGTKSLEEFRVHCNLKNIEIGFTVRQYFFLLDNFEVDLIPPDKRHEFYFEKNNDSLEDAQ